MDAYTWKDLPLSHVLVKYASLIALESYPWISQWNVGKDLTPTKAWVDFHSNGNHHALSINWELSGGKKMGGIRINAYPGSELYEILDKIPH